MNETMTGYEMVNEALGAMILANIRTLAKILKIRRRTIYYWVYFEGEEWIERLGLEGATRQLALNTRELVEIRGEIYETMIDDLWFR